MTMVQRLKKRELRIEKLGTNKKTRRNIGELRRISKIFRMDGGNRPRRRRVEHGGMSE
jgi:hypothetical protein